MKLAHGLLPFVIAAQVGCILPETVGHKIEQKWLDALKVGVTTKAQVLETFGQPGHTKKVGDKQIVGYFWHHCGFLGRSEENASYTLTFGPDDLLLKVEGWRLPSK